MTKRVRAGGNKREPQVNHEVRPLDYCEHFVAKLPGDICRCPWCLNQELSHEEMTPLMAALGWEDVLQNVARKRGFWRSNEELFDLVADLRVHLIHKQHD